MFPNVSEKAGVRKQEMVVLDWLPDFDDKGWGAKGK